MTRHRTLEQLPKNAPNRNNAGESCHQDEVYGQWARSCETPVRSRQDQFIPFLDRREIAASQPTRNPVEHQHRLVARLQLSVAQCIKSMAFFSRATVR